MVNENLRIFKRTVCWVGSWVTRLWLLLLCLLGDLFCFAAQSVVLNEVMTSNGKKLADENGDFPDWLELYNAGTETVDLAGYGLSDERDTPFKWVFREATLGAGEFLLVFASGKDRQPQQVAAANPQSVPGLKLWLSAAAVQANDASQVRSANGRYWIKKWSDQSGSGNHALQASTSAQPEWMPGASALNNHPALRFDGVDDALNLASVLAQNDFCIMAVVRPRLAHEVDAEGAGGVGGVSGQHYLFGASHGGDANAGAGVSVGTNGISVYEHGSG